MVDYLPRSAWRARPRNGGGVALLPSRVVGDALHWPGMAKPINADGDAGMERVASALRGWQNYHMDVRGWSDIAYLVGVDQAGRAWTLRGLNIQSGANGNQDVNERYGAVLLILAPGEKPTTAMIKTVREVQADFCRMFPKARKRPYGHKDVRPAGTDCPGPIAYADIYQGVFDAATTTTSGGSSVSATNDQILAAVQALDTEETNRYVAYTARYEDLVNRLNNVLGKLDTLTTKVNTMQSDVTQIKDDVDGLTTP